MIRSFIKILLRNLVFIKIIDTLISILAIVISPILIIYSRIGASKLKISRETFRKLQIYPIRNHYYEPLFITKDLKDKFNIPRNLPGININDKKQLQLLDNLNFENEILEIDFRKKNPKYNKLKFSIPNFSFNSGEAEFLYQILRYYKPKKLIEIGCGETTKLISQTLEINMKRDKKLCRHICIEPYENKWLKSLDIELYREKVENCDLDIFKELLK